ncbi:MAG: hypothetical protein AAGB34_09475 [Planctomycetota bacterium]
MLHSTCVDEDLSKFEVARLMGVTSKLLALYRVDQQLNGVKGRLQQAERFLKRQEHLLTEVENKKRLIEGQLRQLEATNHNDQTELNSMDERIEKLRDRMNNAQTSKEHSALLTEINTIKADRGAIEDRVLNALSEIETLNTKLVEVENEVAERVKVRDTAKGDREARETEIKDKVVDLEKDRAAAEADVPASALQEYNSRVEMGLEEVMAPVHEEDRRNMVYISEASNQALPIELVNKLLLRQELVIDPFSDAILYIPDDLRESLDAVAEKKRKKREAAETK